MLPSRDLTALHDILRCVEATERHLAGADERRFLHDELLQGAVAQQLFSLGNAARRISAGTRAAAPTIPWQELVLAGELMIEPGAAIDWDLVWRTATRDLLEIRRGAEALLALSPSARRGQSA